MSTGRTTCASGRHPWIPENLIVEKGLEGQIHYRCRACRLERDRQRRIDKKAHKPPLRCPVDPIIEQAQIEIVSRYKLGESTLVLASHYGVSTGRIGRILQKNGVKRRQLGERPIQSNAKWYQIDQELFKKLVYEGHSTTEMGRIFNMSSSRVWTTCRSIGIPLKDSDGEYLSGHRGRRIPQSLFSIPLSPQESWLLGVFLTDGNVSKTGIIKLSSTDKDIPELAKRIVGLGNVFERRIKKAAFLLTGQKIQPRLTPWEYVATSARLSRRLAKLGFIPKKTKILSFPDPTSLSLPDFIRGLWDGDGSWFIDKRANVLCAHFGCASEQFIRELNALLADITKSEAKVRKHSTLDFWQMSYYGQRAVALARWLYNEPDAIGMERKYQVVAPFLQQEPISTVA